MSFSEFKNDAPKILRENVLRKIVESPMSRFIRCDDNYVILKVSVEFEKDSEKDLKTAADFDDDIDEITSYYIFSYPKENTLEDENYNEVRRKELLGRGTSGVVVKGWKIEMEEIDKIKNLKFLPVAVKIVDDKKVSVDQMKLEENINRIFSPMETQPIVYDENLHKIFLITKRLPDEPLMYNQRISPAIKELPLLKKLDFILDILDSVKSLNSIGISHGDLTANNILIDVYSDPIKPYLTDFGNVRSKSIATLTSAGTPGHIAPEVLENRFSETTDIFSIGPDLMAMLGAENVYQNKIAARQSETNIDEQNKAEVKAEFNRSGLENMLKGIDMDSKAKDLYLKKMTNFLNLMVHTDPRSRPSIDETIQFYKIMRNGLERFLETKKKVQKKPSRWAFFTKHKSDSERLDAFIKEEEKKSDIPVRMNVGKG